jgi:hypothetical protein
VIQPGQDAGFTLKLVAHRVLGTLAQAGQELGLLDGAATAFQSIVVGQVYGSHPAAPDEADDPISLVQCSARFKADSQNFESPVYVGWTVTMDVVRDPLNAIPRMTDHALRFTFQMYQDAGVLSNGGASS